MLCVERFGGCEVIRDGGCGFAKHIGHDGIERDIADGKSVLKAVFLAASHRDEFAAATSELTQNADVFAGNEAAFDKTDSEDLPCRSGVDQRVV